MAKDQTDDLEKKKQQIQKELDVLHTELDNTFDDVSSQLNPKTIIRKYPLPIVGASALVGFLLGRKGNSSSDKSKSSSTSGSKSSSSSGGFSSALFSELKRRATRRAVSFATDYIESLLEQKAEEHLSSIETEEE